MCDAQAIHLDAHRVDGVTQLFCLAGSAGLLCLSLDPSLRGGVLEIASQAVDGLAKFGKLIRKLRFGCLNVGTPHGGSVFEFGAQARYRILQLQVDGTQR